MARPEGAEMRHLYRVAATLGRSVREAMDLPLEELAGWSAYFATVDNERR